MIQKLTLLLFFSVVFSISQVSAQDGQAIFRAKCASCHIMGTDGTGPNLQGVIGRWGGDMKALQTWVHNWKDAVAQGVPRATEVISFNSSDMQIFGPSITDADIDAVLQWADKWVKPDPTTKDGPKESGGGGQNAIIFGIISLILAIIALILLQVNSNLKKLSDDAEGIQRPEPVPFYRNKVYIAMVSVVFFIAAGIFFANAGIGLQRQDDYQPKQPIYYSHKVHAGINQISCLYCHGNAWESKTAAIPSVNVCMNCHKTVTEYSKGPQLFDANGEKIDGTAEIQKLYQYAGFDPKNANAWDPSKAKPIHWTKIHNLPDHVFFSHAQHVRAGNVQCQTCHGEITEMDEVHQFAPLSMGWCVNCHRQTKVDFNYDSTKGNQFYSIYESFHDRLKTEELAAVTNNKTLTPEARKFKIDSIMALKTMDSVTVKDIGGLECQKCHY
jgi:cytochrome c2